jgi:hypothetical protein
MRVVVLFLCLCFLLPKGNAFIYAATQDHNFSQTVVQQKGQDHTANPDDCAVISPRHPETELKYLIGDDVEDEDNNDSPVTVISLTTKWQPADACPSFVFILKHPSNCFKSTPRLIGQAPDLCLLQGVFRI